MGSSLKCKSVLVAVLVCVLSLVAVGAAEGATITVRADGSGDYPTIQAAIDDANNGDEIICEDGVYTGEGNRNIIFLGKAVTVRSENGPENCIIDCEGDEERFHGGFFFLNREDGNSILEGLTICNGYCPMGGAIFCEGGSSPTIINCILEGNTSLYEGGAIAGRYEDTFPAIIGCKIIGNTGDGAVTYCYGPITNCIISNNWGVGLRSCNGPITDCTISGNYDGGLSFCSGEIKNCRITGNSDVGDGGGVSFCKGQLTNCIISGNSSGRRGGGIFSMDYYGPNIVNCTITGNSSAEGGAIYCFRNSKPNITNSILWGNWPEEIVLRNDTLLIEYSNIQDGWEGLGNIDADPCFVESGYWVDVNDVNIVVEPNDVNAVWFDGDYHLLEGSACINAGDPNYTAGLGETDLDGMPRVLLGRVDMGAYEFDWPPLEVEVRLTPQMLNCASKGNWVKAHVILPEGYWPEDIDVNTPAVAEPMGAESEYIKVFGNGKGKFGVEIGFEREAFCAVEPESEDGYLEVKVTGWLLTGQRFEGTDTIKIISQRWRHRHRKSTGKKR
jgi:hypothetical protein